MNNVTSADQVEVGRSLAQVRERADIKQSELARRIMWSPAVLSRVENGERSVTASELQLILDAISTPDSVGLSRALQREWSVLPRPQFDHPDQDLLWSAEQVAKDLIALCEQPDVRHAFERRLSAYIVEIKNTAGLILKRDYQIAFIGPIGIGKSTAICRVTGLEVPGQDGGRLVPVLEAGAGGITISEVHLRTGLGYGLLIEPRSDEEIRADVADFAEHIMRGRTPPPDEQEEADNESLGISKEIERAIRNMAGLKVRREKAADGKTTRRDEAKELGQSMGNARELVVEVLSRMELYKRDRRDVWYDSGCGKTPLAWLKDMFEEVNNGRHPEFTLPRRIEVVMPEPLFGWSDLAVRVIDTKGIDQTAARADLEGHLDEPHTLAVLCSGFNDAPSAAARLLLERAKQAGIRTLSTHAALVVLPRPDEALAVKDEAGIRAETPEEGYELKGEQIIMSLESSGLDNLAVGFFNAYQDDAGRLKSFLHDRISVVQETFRNRLHEIVGQARNLLGNQEQEQVQEVMRQAAVMLRSWAGSHMEPGILNAHVQDSLIDQMGHVYASTIRATVRRDGEWPNLNYSHHLGFGARRVATLALGKTVESFRDLCRTMAANPEFGEAQDLLNQAERVLVAAYEELLRKVQLMGQTSFLDQLKADANFWSSCAGEWGNGSGYRDRVVQRNKDWFHSERRQEIERELQTLIRREWAVAISKMTALLETEH